MPGLDMLRGRKKKPMEMELEGGSTYAVSASSFQQVITMQTMQPEATMVEGEEEDEDEDEEEQKR